MKFKFLILAILTSCVIQAQDIKGYLKDNWKEMSLMFISGSCDGQVETLLHHYPAFKKRFPNANDSYWNPSISWKNKYENFDAGLKGEKFPTSSTALVWTTDAYHLFRMGHKISAIGALTIKIGSNTRRNYKVAGYAYKKKKFKHYLIDFIVYSTCYQIGFHTTYNLIY